MAKWETADELSGAAVATLPTPADTPYRTPSRTSRKSGRSMTPPAPASSSPPPVSSENSEKRASKRLSKDASVDESISILDPRRFTPTLHANLVSEILALRRDQDDKLKTIERLEASLHTSQQEQEAIQTNLTDTAKESRSLKRQLALLEGGTSSALTELARERDDAVEIIAETKRRFETAQKKVRLQEEDSQRIHELWAKEKDDWEEEKRKYERRLHVAESRIKLVLEEYAHLQAAQPGGSGHEAEDGFDDTGKDNDGTSVRTRSITNSVRFSMINGSGMGKVNGHSLADELNFDDDSDYQTDADGRQSVLSGKGHNRNQSRESIISRSHRRNQSVESQFRSGGPARGRFLMNQAVMERLESGIREDDETEAAAPARHTNYRDTGVQFSPPPTPKLVASKPSTPEPTKIERTMDLESSPRGELEIEANQRRKRVHINRSMPIEIPKAAKSMVATASQTSEELLGPEPVPEVIVEDAAVSSLRQKPQAEYKSASVQTDAMSKALEPLPLSAPAPLLIPSISIIPPTSRPTTPREHRLPQYVKDFGCQVSIQITRPLRSAAVQTDEIRTDQRLDRLPPHLRPSAISSRPTSPVPAVVEEAKNFTPVPGHLPPRNPRRLESNRSFSKDSLSTPPASPVLDEQEPQDAYPGNNDDGPLSSSKMAPVRRPHRVSSLFAGFDAASSDEEFGGHIDNFDSEYRTALSAPRPMSRTSRYSKRTSATVSPTSPGDWHPLARSSKGTSSGILRPKVASEVYSSSNLARKPSVRAADRPIMNPSSRASLMRKAAIIQSGIASHQARSRSPSLPESRNPPFPIPTRASSRKPPFTASAPSDGQRSPTHGRGPSSGVHRNNSVRKVRSAAAIPGNGKYKKRTSRSPPPMSPSDVAPESPVLPPLPRNDLTNPRVRDSASSRYRAHKSQPSTNTAYTENTNLGSVNSSQQASGVVDAIAQTMVGEWMYKYVRRRKSFGVVDGNSRVEESSNDRHKRWVWLAPYERSILWSSKQPTSGNALLGKSGRKLIIQSVLDVKDDNPLPKGTTQIFNRSILILTPQRALKFTAVSSERHYLWLTSLSFLAHSQQAIPEIIGSTQAPAPAPKLGPPTVEPHLPMPPPRAKRANIRDSIRLTKGKHATMTERPDQMINVQQLEEALAFNPEVMPVLPGHQRGMSRDVAEPPFVPRFHERSNDRIYERANQVVLHGRKRSNTGGHGHAAPPLSFRGFSSPTGPGSSYHASTNSTGTAGVSVGTAGSSDIYQSQVSSNGMTWGMSTTGSQRTSVASSRAPGNFFEAIGTVRMEAFISPLAFPRFEEHPDENEEWRHRARRRSKEIRRRRSRSRHRDSHPSRGTRGTESTYAGSRARGDEDFDPFKGF